MDIQCRLDQVRVAPIPGADHDRVGQPWRAGLIKYSVQLVASAPVTAEAANTAILNTNCVRGFERSLTRPKTGSVTPNTVQNSRLRHYRAV
jgi:hypothetical protein